MLERVGESTDKLGECPTWDDTGARLLRIDVVGRQLVACDADGGRVEAAALPGIPGSFAMRSGGGLLVAYRARLAMRDPGGTETPVPLPPGWDGERERFNDGACDARGRFWVGTMDRHFRDPVGALYRVDPDLSVRRVLAGLGMSNGIAWSPDGTIMYHCDSRPGVIHSYEFDLETGLPGAHRVLVAPTPAIGMPDGCAVDLDGFLWVAAPDVGQVIRFDPAGQVERRVATPASRPTSVVFGGADLRTLFITSMQPMHGPVGEADGGLFAFRAPVPGVPKRRFGPPRSPATPPHATAGTVPA